MDKDLLTILVLIVTFTFGYFAGGAKVAGEYIDNYEALSADLDKLKNRSCNITNIGGEDEW